MTTFLFVRHGETIMNTTPDLIGGRSVQTPLTEQGEQQARLLGKYLRTQIAPHFVFSSGALRTNQTAQFALQSAEFTHDIIEDERLLEISHGRFEGIQRQLAYTPENKTRYNIGTFDGKFPEGESIRDVENRMKEFLFETHQTHPEATILIFGHGFAIRTLAGAFRNFSVRQILDELTDNVSLTRINVVDNHATVEFVGKNVIDTHEAPGVYL